MGAPLHNQNAKGHDGHNAGRLNRFQTMARRERLAQMYFEKHNRAEVQDRLKSGRHNVEDVMLAKALAGNERMLLYIFNQVYPKNGGGEREDAQGYF